MQKTPSTVSIVPILILLAVSLAVYSNALLCNFVYDDTWQIVNNPWLRDTGNIPAIFVKNVWSFQPDIVSSNYYRPLMHIVYMLNYHVFGLKPWGFHLVNILLHGGVTVLVFLVVRRLLAEYVVPVSRAYLAPPFIAAMLFASHPIHTEAVTWIAGLPDVACTFFYLLSLYLYILFRDGAKRGYLLSLLSFSVAAFFKEPALTLPIMLIAYDHLLKKSDETLVARIERYLPYIVVSGIYLLARYHALRGLAPLDYYAGLSTYQYIINVFPLFREYLAGLLLPLHLNFWHSFHPVSSLFEPEAMISAGVAVLFLMVAVAAHRKNKVLLFSLLLVAVPLLPVFYIKAIPGKPFAERYLYLPSVGYVLLPAIFLSWASEKLPRAAASITILFIAIGGAYAAGTINRNNIWRDDVHLWTDTVKRSPDSADAHYNLGYIYASQDQFDRAIAQYQTALNLKPDYAEAHNNLGYAYASQGQLDKAIAQYQTALGLKPSLAQAHNNLGAAYTSQGQLDKAIAEFQTALGLKPDYAEAHSNLGDAYNSQGQLDKAVAEFQTALSLKPNLAQAHNDLGSAYASQGQLDRAIAEFQTALGLKPDYAEAHNNLGFAYTSQGRLDGAIAEFQTALRLKPDFAQAHNDLGYAYALQGHVDRGIAEYQTALRLKPDYAEVHNNLGTAYVSQRRVDSAITEFQTALRLKPDYAKAHDNLGFAYALQGRIDGAIAEFQAALRLKPDFAQAHNDLGIAYSAEGQLDKAIAEFQTALRLKPDLYEARRRLNDIVSRRR